jgi:hypothetical protein
MNCFAAYVGLKLLLTLFLVRLFFHLPLKRLILHEPHGETSKNTAFLIKFNYLLDFEPATFRLVA